MIKTISNYFPLIFLVGALALIIGILMNKMDFPEYHIWFKVGETEE